MEEEEDWCSCRCCWCEEEEGGSILKRTKKVGWAREMKLVGEGDGLRRKEGNDRWREEREDGREVSLAPD